MPVEIREIINKFKPVRQSFQNPKTSSIVMLKTRACKHATRAAGSELK